MTEPARRSTDAVLRDALRGDGATRAVTLDPSFQGLPDTAHGGAILALFDAASGLRGPRTLAGTYRRRVPLLTPLVLAVDPGARMRLSLGATLLVDGVVDAAPVPAVRGADGESGRAVGVREPRAPGVGSPGSRRPPSPPGSLSASRNAGALPISKTCFACGVENPLGLHAQLGIDDDYVGGTWTPTTSFRDSDGVVSTIAITTLLDEAAFWLGAAASGEAGMTTDLRVQIHRLPTADGDLLLAGPRAAVRSHADDPRYWDTEVAMWDASGRLVATARISFVAVRGAARKLVTGLLAINPPDVLGVIFPAYAR